MRRKWRSAAECGRVVCRAIVMCVGTAFALLGKGRGDLNAIGQIARMFRTVGQARQLRDHKRERHPEGQRGSQTAK